MISNWLELNRLQLNTEKSKFMLFHMPQKSILNLKLIIFGLIIEPVTQFKFLGLNINSNLIGRLICLQLVLKCPESLDCCIS